jgi:hypothetical protein
MPARRALIVAPIYATPMFPLLAGYVELLKRLPPCLEKHGDYQVEIIQGQVKQEDLREAIYRFFDTDGELLFYFYGHGHLRVNQGIFVTSDAKPYNEGVPMSEVIDQARQSRAREIVLLLDCCHSGAATPTTPNAIEPLGAKTHPAALC